MNDGDTSPMIWIPRPIEDALTVSEEVRALGFEPFVEPVMTIHYLDIEPDMDGVTGLVFTSANGVRAFVRTKPDRHIPVYAVGSQCASIAREAGFSTIITAGGDVDKLAAKIIEHRSPDEGTLLHIAATERAGDLSGSLEKHGFEIRRNVLYSAVIIDALPDSVREWLQSKRQSAVLLFSPRTAAAVSRLLSDAGLSDATETVHAICLSQAVAEKLNAKPWASVVVAEELSRGSMLDALCKALKITSTEGADLTGDSDNTEKKPQFYGTETISTPTVSADTKRTHHEGTANNEKTEGASGSMNAEHVIEQFGGIRPMAQKLGIAVSTVQGWKTRDNIPENRWDDVRAAAAEAGIELEAYQASDDATETAVPTTDVESPGAAETANEQPESSDTKEDDEVTEEAGNVAPSSEPVAADGETVKDEPIAANSPSQSLAAKPTRSGSGGWALFFALVALAGIATRGYWGPAVDPKVEAHLTNFFGPPVAQQATAVDETIQTDLVRTQEVVATMLKRLEDMEERATALDGSFQGSDASLISLDAINDRISSLEDRLDSTPAISEGGNVDLAAFDSALSALRTRMASLDGKTDNSIETFQLEINTFSDQLTAISNDLAAATALIDSIGNRLLQVENSPGNPAVSTSALVLAVGQLEIIAASGSSFVDALPGLQELAGDDAKTAALVESLKEASWEGVSTVSSLAAQFADIATLVDAAETSEVGGDWIDESLSALQSVVSVRRIDQSPDAPAATRAEIALAHGDLASAVSLVEPYADADESIADWLASAKARLAVDQAITTLRARAVDQLRAMSATN